MKPKRMINDSELLELREFIRLPGGPGAKLIDQIIQLITLNIRTGIPLIDAIVSRELQDREYRQDNKAA